MMVLGPKHVGVFLMFLMCKVDKFYISAVVGIIIERKRDGYK